MKQQIWLKAQQRGVAIHNGEVIYADNTPLDHLLDAAILTTADCTFRRLSPQQFDEQLELIFQQDSGTAQLIAEGMNNVDDLNALSEEIPTNEDLLNEQSDAPVIRLINAVLNEASGRALLPAFEPRIH